MSPVDDEGESDRENLAALRDSIQRSKEQYRRGEFVSLE